MKQYLDLLDDIIKNGFERNDRTGTGTIGVFGRQLRFPMKDGFPLLTTKKLHLRSIIYELLWFLQGGTNIKYLKDNGVSIWNEWADKDGNLGPVYGSQWRSWRKYVYYGGQRSDFTIEYIDQISKLIETLKTSPDNRRMLVSAWNVSDLDEMLFPPCHYGFQVSTRELLYDEKIMWAIENIKGFGKANEVDGIIGLDGFTGPGSKVPQRSISLMWQQRSVDTFLGLPFNIASYALLLMMLGQVVNMIPEDLVCSLGDTHIYKNHLEQANLQISREPFKLPTMSLNSDINNIDDFKFEDFKLNDYICHPHIKADISI